MRCFAKGYAQEEGELPTPNNANKMSFEHIRKEAAQFVLKKLGCWIGFTHV